MNNKVYRRSPCFVTADRDLIQYSRHIDREPSSLCGYLGFPDETLEEIRRNHKKITVQAYTLFTKWRENNPQATKQDLRNILEELGFLPQMT